MKCFVVPFPSKSSIKIKRQAIFPIFIIILENMTGRRGGEGRKKREKKEENFELYRNAFNFGNRLEEILFYVYEQHRWFVKRELRVSGNSTSNIFASFIVS